MASALDQRHERAFDLDRNRHLIIECCVAFRGTRGQRERNGRMIDSRQLVRLASAMATKSYIAGVPFDSRAAGWVLPDTSALDQILRELFAKIDGAGETVIGIQGLNDNNGMTIGMVVLTKTS